MNLISYLSAILGKSVGHDAQISQLLKGQQKIMADLAAVQAQLQAVKDVVSGLGAPIAQISDAVANVAADIQALKDQIGQAPVGITPEEADGVVADLGDTLGRIQTASESLANVAAALQSVADAQ